MGKYRTFYSEAEIDVSLEDWDTDELLEELESRDVESRTKELGDADLLLSKIYEQRRMGMDYQTELDQLIYIKLGRIV